MSEKTAEQIAAEAAAAEQAAAAAKAAKDAEKAAAKAKKEADAADRKAKKEAEKADKEAKKAAEKAAKEAEKANSKMLEQNGVRRPKAETLCGKAWAIFDNISAKNCAPASIKESLDAARADGLNEGNVKAEYARWRKFYAISGRIAAPVVEAPAAPVAPAEGAQAAATE